MDSPVSVTTLVCQYWCWQGFLLRVLAKGANLMAPGSGSSRLCGAKREVQGAVPFCRGGWQEEADSSEKMT